VLLRVSSEECETTARIADQVPESVRAVRVRLRPIPTLTVRFIDTATGAPVRGVTLLDTDGVTPLTSDEAGEVRVRRARPVILPARHPQYQTAGISPLSSEGDVLEVPLYPKRTLRVSCTLDGEPCPGHTDIRAMFFRGDHQRDTEAPPSGHGLVLTQCTWEGPGSWVCERGVLQSVSVLIEEPPLDFTVPPGVDEFALSIPRNAVDVCVDFEPPGAACVLEFGDGAVPIVSATPFSLSADDLPQPGRIVCPEAHVWANLVVKEGPGCAVAGPWEELAGICVRPEGGPPVEDQLGSPCVLLDAALVTGDGGIAQSSSVDLSACPAWYPPGDYMLACGDEMAVPVRLVAGEVLEVAPPAGP
jgi:hypothetical protein